MGRSYRIDSIIWWNYSNPFLMHIGVKIFIVILLNIIMARYHAYLILSGKKILHGVWGFIYLICVVFLWTNPIFILNSFFIRKFFFDTSLNYFRGLNFFYVSTRTTSLMDKFHNWLFGKKSEYYQIVYFIIFVLLSCYLMIKY